MVVDAYITGASGMMGFETLRYFEQTSTGRSLGVATRPLPDRYLPSKIVPNVFEPTWHDPADKNATIVHFADLSDPRAKFDSFSQLAAGNITACQLGRTADSAWVARAFHLYLVRRHSLRRRHHTANLCKRNPHDPKDFTLCKSCASKMRWCFLPTITHFD